LTATCNQILNELDRLPFLVHCAVEIFAVLPDFDAGLVYSEGRAAHLQMVTYPLIDFGSITLNPTKQGRVIHVEAALTHHLFDITVRKLVAPVSSNAQRMIVGS
jgi:hypothetical protein